MTNAPSIDDVYRKFGEVSEAAQLLETELGNLLLSQQVIKAGLIRAKDPEKATQLLEHINKSTLGQLLKKLQGAHEDLETLEKLLTKAKLERNRLSHSFYRQHNFRRNTSKGRSLMIQDIESIHEAIFQAYRAILKLSGIDIDKIKLKNFPSGHVPI